MLSIYKKEQPLGVIAQFGGQTPLNLAAELEKNGEGLLHGGGHAGLGHGDLQPVHHGPEQIPVLRL